MTGIGKLHDGPLLVEAVWKHQRRQLSDTASATLGLRPLFPMPISSVDGQSHLMSAIRPSWAAATRKNGLYAPTNIIAFIAFLIPRMLSTRLKL